MTREIKEKTKRTNKKGASHLEIILSFIIFLGFSLFLLAIFRPTTFLKYTDTDLNILETSIKSVTLTPISFITLNLNKDIEIQECFFINYELNLDNVIVKNKDGEIVNAETDKENERIYIYSISEKFFYVYFSEKLEEKEFIEDSCTEIDSSNYHLGLYRNYNLTSYEKLENLKQDYTNDYENLKNQLGIPTTKEFAFIVKDTRGNDIIVARKRVEQPNVLARDITIQILYNNGTLRYGILNIQTW